MTKDQRAELAALGEMPDDLIDAADIPELLDWPDARRGVFYDKSRPVPGQSHFDEYKKEPSSPKSLK